MVKSLLSVVVPVYNGEEYLQQCIESIQTQSFRELEIILVDDGSVDASPVLCDMLADKDKRIQVIHKKNAGAAAARKSGLEQITGDYVAFVDADDWLERDFLEKMMTEAIQNHADAVVGGFKTFSNDTYKSIRQTMEIGEYNRQRCEQKLYAQMLSAAPFYTFGIMPSMCGKLFRTEIAKKNLQALDTGIIFGEDGCFTYSVLLDCESIVITEANGYIYRQNSASATHRFNEKLLPDGVKLKAFLEKLAKEKNWNVNSQIDEYMAYVCNYTVTRALKAGYTDTKEGKKQLKTYIKSLFPQGLLKNSRFQKCSRKMKVRFWLISHCFFNILKKLI